MYFETFRPRALMYISVGKIAKNQSVGVYFWQYGTVVWVQN